MALPNNKLTIIADTPTCADSVAVLKNTLGTTISTTSIVSGDTSDITAPDSTITINSASFSTYVSGATSNILVKDGTGTQVGSKVGSEWIVPSGSSPSGVSFQKIIPRQRISYRTGDEGWRVQNGFYDYTQPATPKVYAELDNTIGGFFSVLKSPLVVNGVSNTLRFVDVDGSQTFSATNNKSFVVIDKLTGLMYTRRVATGLPAVVWNTAIDGALTYSIVVNSITYDDWYLASFSEFVNVYHLDTTVLACNDIVTNIELVPASGNIWTSTTHTAATTSGYYFELSPRTIAPISKSVALNVMLVRDARSLITAP